MKDIVAFTGLIVAITGLIGTLGGILALLKRTKSIDVKVNGHVTRLLDVLEQANVTIPSGAKVKYIPPAPPTDAETTDALQFLAEIKEAVKNDTG